MSSHTTTTDAVRDALNTHHPYADDGLYCAAAECYRDHIPWSTDHILEILNETPSD